MKYIKYLSYLFRHKWYVFVECCKVGIYWQGIKHDWSKFLPSELIPYTNFFYGEKPANYKGFHEPGENIAFDTAWLKHIHRNPHHWQYYVLNNDSGDTKCLPIPVKYVSEMICDWKGAGKAQGHNGPNECRDWYLKNKDKMKLHPETRMQVEVILQVQ